MTRPDERCEIRPFPKIRRAYVDVLREGHRRHIIHGLVEVDVTDARAAISQRAATGELPLSFTGFIVACVGQAVDPDRILHAHRWGRRKLVLFESVDVNMQLEQTEPDGTRIVQSRIAGGVNHRTVEAISAEIGQARAGTRADRRRLRGTLAFVSLPTPPRALLWRLTMARLSATKRFGGTIAVDDDIIDGAPAARFVERLRRTIEEATGLAAPARQPLNHRADQPVVS